MLFCPETEEELTVVRTFLATSEFSSLFSGCFYFITYLNVVCKFHKFDQIV